jgi:hypothetical protein
MQTINAKNYAEVLAAMGFRIFGTGGGCTAWHKEYPNGNYVLITDGDLGHELDPSMFEIEVAAYNPESEMLGNEAFWSGGFDGLPAAIAQFCELAQA